MSNPSFEHEKSVAAEQTVKARKQSLILSAACG
jgi:hypothetical protein